MSFSQESFRRFIIDAGVVGFFSSAVTLKSGRKSNFYVNWRNASSDAFLLDRLGEFVVEFLEDRFPDAECLYGVPEGATKAAVIAGMKWAKRSPSFSRGRFSIPMGRGQRKEHGDPKDRLYIGEPVGRTIVLEDVTTSGGSLLAAVQELRDAGCKVMGALGLTHRMERRDDGKTVDQAFQSQFNGEVPYVAMSSVLELLPEAALIKQPNTEILCAIQKEFETYGERPIRWK